MKLLIIGCGSIGKRHAQNAKAFADVSVCDADASRMEGLDAQTYTDIDEALDSKPDGVVVAREPGRRRSGVLDVAVVVLAAGAARRPVPAGLRVRDRAQRCCHGSGDG